VPFFVPGVRVAVDLPAEPGRTWAEQRNFLFNWNAKR
jgi:hypothetical protein